MCYGTEQKSAKARAGLILASSHILTHISVWHLKKSLEETIKTPEPSLTQVFSSPDRCHSSENKRVEAVSAQNGGTDQLMISRSVLTFVSNYPAFFGIMSLSVRYSPLGQHVSSPGMCSFLSLWSLPSTSHSKYTARSSAVPSQSRHNCSCVSVKAEP